MTTKNTSESAIKYLLWDNTDQPRFATFEDFIAWGKKMGMDFSECRTAFDYIKSTCKNTSN